MGLGVLPPAAAAHVTPEEDSSNKCVNVLPALAKLQPGEDCAGGGNNTTA